MKSAICPARYERMEGFAGPAPRLGQSYAVCFEPLRLRDLGRILFFFVNIIAAAALHRARERYLVAA